MHQLWSLYGDRLPEGSDLCCYFFERARAQIEAGKAKRVGLLATNSIRAIGNREVLNRIKRSGDIYLAWSDEPWVLNGAAVRISIVGFENGNEQSKQLNVSLVPWINSDLTSRSNMTVAVPLPENLGLTFVGVTPIGSFEIEAKEAEDWRTLPPNVNGKSNADVIRPYVNARDVVQRSGKKWIVDFGVGMSEVEAAQFEAPFEHVRAVVLPERLTNRRESYRLKWWQHGEARPAMRTALAGLSRFLVTPRVSKHRLFLWLPGDVLPGNKLAVFARDDDYFFGMLHSRAHEVWSLRMGAWQGVGNDPVYQNTACFETFPLPWPPGEEPTDDPRVIAIGEAAAALNELRERWLNPPGIGETELKTRTLTNLYNQRPTWLQHAHASLDRAAWASYGWDDPDPAAVDEDTILSRLLALNLERAAVEPG